MATMVWESNRGEAAKSMLPAAARRKKSIRDRVDAVRDTLVVLAIQIVFRAMQLLRRWNY
jgi:hypothetical protein